MNKQKTIIILAVIFLVVLIIVFILLTNMARRSGTTATNPTPSIVPTVDLNNQSAQITLHIAAQEEHYDEEFPETVEITDAEIENLEEGIPANFVPVPQNPDDTPASKISPDGKLMARFAGNAIVVTSTDSSTEIARFNLETDIAETAYVWLRDNTILLVEKESTDLQIDKVYLLSLTTKEKQFILGSFPVASRFNLDVEPAVYNNSEAIVFTDNEGEKWLMSIEYKQ